jgi:hypothetical protein
LKPGRHIYSSEARKWLGFMRRAGVGQFVLTVGRHFAAPWIIGRLRRQVFPFKGESLDYFYHRYNLTWVTERAIEVPIARYYLRGREPAGVLEVGNVLSHYQEVRHTVLDRFEPGVGGVAEDIVTYRPGRRFALILSISTFEHIGYEDEGGPDPGKVLEAIAACRRLLEPLGRLVITVPFGYNAWLDDMVRSGRVAPEAAFFFERTGKLTWQACGKEAALERAYGRPYPFANGIMVAEFSAAEEVSGGCEAGGGR